MTVLEIKLIPDPVLRKKAEPVKVVTNDIISVLNDMAEDLGVKKKEQISLAGGGMANMDDIIKPIGV